jgi:hypothetical protein
MREPRPAQFGVGGHPKEANEKILAALEEMTHLGFWGTVNIDLPGPVRQVPRLAY